MENIRRQNPTTERASNAYDLPSISQTVKYLHAATGFPTEAHFLLDGMMISCAHNSPNQSHRLFRANWAFYVHERQINELVVSIATLAIVVILFWRFYHVACAIAKKVPHTKRVSIRK
jgi:hypothetical protein